MLGFSVYLGSPLTPETHAAMVAYADAGFTGVFTSLHIPEDDATVLAERVGQLGQWCRELNLTLTADISVDGFKRLGWDPEDVDTILATGVSSLRVDYGLEMPVVAAMSRVMPVALNASTLTAADFCALKDAHADFNHLEAWHNYYPRPETGLERSWTAEKNNWLHAQGLTTMAFIPGDDQLRAPLYRRLPTLESHRQWSSLAAAVDLAAIGTDKIFVGDGGVSPATLTALSDWATNQIVTLQVDDLPSVLIGSDWHNRPDVARDVVRLEEARHRQLLPTTPQPATARPVGSLTVDNANYGRYAGEIQLTRRNLPPDAAVNVVGRVVPADRPLLNLIGAGTALRLVVAEREKGDGNGFIKTDDGDA